MFKILDLTKNDLIAFKAEGKIEKKDYEKLQPILEKTERENEKLKMYIEIGDLGSITPEAMLEDVATYFNHIPKVEKLAVLGEGTPEKSWAKIADPFIKADIKYFPVNEKDVAIEWLKK